MTMGLPPASAPPPPVFAAHPQRSAFSPRSTESRTQRRTLLVAPLVCQPSLRVSPGRRCSLARGRPYNLSAGSKLPLLRRPALSPTRTLPRAVCLCVVATHYLRLWRRYLPRSYRRQFHWIGRHFRPPFHIKPRESLDRYSKSSKLGRFSHQLCSMINSTIRSVPWRRLVTGGRAECRVGAPLIINLGRRLTPNGGREACSATSYIRDFFSKKSHTIVAE
ncbi:hypothetical protein BDY21DRAFT_137137 [Lineolata rhizophorae]|uniref:Uncharacterized protein n=1 Tax=Lineolata rhizophorae TaxID=578093 RepID=A0A6A6PB95_9PEZI|nr:hypothetical protein BDY21DRAFT_137137 [Lineolata rhizophorae]